MGTPVPDESNASLCSTCWGPGGAFGPNTNPLVITVTFDGIEKTPAWHAGFGEPPDGPYILPQFEGFPCFYPLVLSDNQVMYVLFNAGSTIMESTSTLGHRAYFAEVGECEKESENETTSIFENGTATVSF